MYETILIARDRKTGEDVILADRSVPYPKQKALYREIAGPTHDKYSHCILASVTPCAKPLKFKTKDEVAARQAEHEAFTIAEAKARLARIDAQIKAANSEPEAEQAPHKQTKAEAKAEKAAAKKSEK